MSNTDTVKTYDNTQNPIQSLLIGGPDANLDELQGLVHTLGMEIVKKITLPRITHTAKFGIGTGKSLEISKEAEAIQADCIIFDFDITPTQQRNWEVLANIPVFDKQEVILRIFAQRAQTKEAILQVELAKLQYSLPRLAHTYGDMAKQRGGNFGAKGSGETQLELDRRAVVSKSAKIKKDLEKIVKERETQRKRREQTTVSVAALVGYTNAGKSSLLNALTESDVFVEDKLFATLDPTTRRLTLQGKTELLLTDTVGFISNLPHSLIDAFKSTLEESARANLQLLVLDGADPEVFNQYKTVINVLKEIDAIKNERIIVINKCDKVITPEIATQLKHDFPEAIWTSASTGQGLEKLTEVITQKLFGKIQEFYIPLDRADLVQKIRTTGMLIKEEWQDSCIKVTARIKGKSRSFFNQYLTKI
ncbi:MAG: GTPase HflX [Treponema sp. CETP13]|nr:MAG: GTPase HflX [Treponema sp. CETP13]